MRSSSTATNSTAITVAICTYNNAVLLNRVLASVEQQHIRSEHTWSTLVMDNNSSDATRDVVQRYMDRGLIPGLQYVREKRQGLGFARRRAVLHTESDLIAFVDDDCLLAPDWVEQAMVFYQGHPTIGAVGGRVQLLWESTPGDIALRYASMLAEQNFGDAPRRLYSVGLVGAGIVLRRTALIESGWLDRMIMTDRRGNKLSAHGDTEMLLRIRNVGYELWYNPVMRLEHYIPRQRMSLDYLCRLQRGGSRGLGIVSALADNKKPSFRQRLGTLDRAVLGFARFSLSVVVQDLLLKQRIGSPERRMLFYNLLGQLEGAWDALPGRFDI